MSTVTNTPEEMRPPEPPGFRTWVRKNLFNSWFNSLLTIVSLVLIYLVVSGLIRWIFTQADWEPVLKFPFLYLVGSYPRDQLWRVGLLLVIYSMMIGLSWRKWSGIMRVLTLNLCRFLCGPGFLASSNSNTRPVDASGTAGKFGDYRTGISNWRE